MKTKRNITKIAAWGAVFLLLITPVFVLAQPNPVPGNNNPIPEGEGLVPCGNPGQPDCSFGAAVQLVQNIMNWLIYIGVYVAGAMFVYAGVLYLTAGANPGNVAKARRIFTNTMWGFAIMLGAWLIVYTIVSAFFKEGFLTLLKT